MKPDFDLMELAISDAGPNCPVHVYVRTSGKIVWTSKVPLFFRKLAYRKAIERATKLVNATNTRFE